MFKKVINYSKKETLILGECHIFSLLNQVTEKPNETPLTFQSEVPKPEKNYIKNH